MRVSLTILAVIVGSSLGIMLVPGCTGKPSDSSQSTQKQTASSPGSALNPAHPSIAKPNQPGLPNYAPRKTGEESDARNWFENSSVLFSVKILHKGVLNVEGIGKVSVDGGKAESFDGSRTFEVQAGAELSMEGEVEFKAESGAAILVDGVRFLEMEGAGRIVLPNKQTVYLYGECKFTAAYQWQRIDVHGRARLYVNGCKKVEAYNHSRVYAQDCDRVCFYNSTRGRLENCLSAEAYGFSVVEIVGQAEVSQGNDATVTKTPAAK